MPVRKDTRGRWFYRTRVRLPDGRRVRIFGTPAINTRAAAEAAERSRVMALYQTGEDRKPSPRFDDFAMRWMKTYPSAAGNRTLTVDAKRVHLEKHLSPALRAVPLDQIRGEVLDRLFAKLHESLAPKTVKNIRGTLGTLLKTAHKWGELRAVPDLPPVKVPDQPWDFLSREEAEDLYAAAVDADERALFLFAIHTGARWGEQRAIAWGDLDWTRRQVVIRKSMPHNTDEVAPTKSGRERRVPMSGTLHDTMKAIRDLRHLKGGLVFGRRADGGALSLYAARERLERACRKAGLRVIRWHDLRHSFASQLVTAGVSIRQVQEWMGHTTIAMTMRYAHLAPGGGDAIRALDSGQRAGSAKTGRRKTE